MLKSITFKLGTVSLTKRQKAKLEATELKMVRLLLGVTKIEKIKNKGQRGEAEMLWTFCRGMVHIFDKGH